MAYNGSSQHYHGVSSYSNGGLLGTTQTFYKKNFFTAITASVGASVAEANTMYGHENFSSLMAGVASKSGYNFEFKEGKYIIQPIWLMSYTFINTFDYTNAAGVKLDSDPMSIVQFKPGIKFMANYKHHWHPYAAVSVVWNVLNHNKVMANDVRLPNMSTRPFVEYGIGVQRCFNEKNTAFLEAMIRNGGRQGIVLNGGFRWKLGKDGDPIEKVQNPQPKVIKQVTKPTIDDKLGTVNFDDKLELNTSNPQDIANRVNNIMPNSQNKKIIKQINEKQKFALKRNLKV